VNPLCIAAASGSSLITLVAYYNHFMVIILNYIIITIKIIITDAVNLCDLTGLSKVQYRKLQGVSPL